MKCQKRPAQRGGRRGRGERRERGGEERRARRGKRRARRGSTSGKSRNWKHLNGGASPLRMDKSPVHQCLTTPLPPINTPHTPSPTHSTSSQYSLILRHTHTFIYKLIIISTTYLNFYKTPIGSCSPYSLTPVIGN